MPVSGPPRLNLVQTPPVNVTFYESQHLCLHFDEKLYVYFLRFGRELELKIKIKFIFYCFSHSNCRFHCNCEEKVISTPRLTAHSLKSLHVMSKQFGIFPERTSFPPF